jgi:hypothetical protein
MRRGMKINKFLKSGKIKPKIFMYVFHVGIYFPDDPRVCDTTVLSD